MDKFIKVTTSPYETLEYNNFVARKHIVSFCAKTDERGAVIFTVNSCLYVKETVIEIMAMLNKRND